MMLTVLFHPLLLLTYLFGLLIVFNPLSLTSIPESAYFRFLLLIFLTTFAMPFLLVVLFLVLFKRGYSFRALFLENSKDRVMPFLIVAIFYSMIVYLVGQRGQLSPLVYLVFILTTLIILITALISNYWKISAHAIGYAGMVSMLMIIHMKSPHSFLFYPVIGLLLIGGFLLSSRLHLRAHNPTQVYAGFMMGFSIGACLYFFL
jgi:membrane-associated phospholipid phosphatase